MDMRSISCRACCSEERRNSAANKTTERESDMKKNIVARMVLMGACCVLASASAQSSTVTPPAFRMPTGTTKFANITFVVFDTETTGFSPAKDRLVEIGAVKIRNGEKIDERISRIALGRLGTPEDIANACSFLASDRASYISGHILGVDGCASI